jgi:hypothetical protein
VDDEEDKVLLATNNYLVVSVIVDLLQLVLVAVRSLYAILDL